MNYELAGAGDRSGDHQHLSPEPDFPPAFNWYSSEGVLGIQRTTEYTASRLGFCFFAGAESQIARGMRIHGGPHAPQQN